MGKEKKILITHPTGNANVRAVLRGIVESESAFIFITSIALFSPFLNKLLTYIPFVKEARRRFYDIRIQYNTITYPFNEVIRLFLIATKRKKLVAHETGKFSIDAICHSIDRSASKVLKQKSAEIGCVYSYEDSALETFTAAKQLGVRKIYDLPIGYYKAARQLMQEELLKRPEWVSTMKGFNDSDAKLQRKDKEIELADMIFVASSFTAHTLTEYYQNALPPIKVVPYGFPQVAGPEKEYNYTGQRPLKLLFVGGLSQRKGIADVLDAVDKLENKVSLTIIGRKSTDSCLPLNNGLKKHNWIESLPHEEILKQMASHDVLVFPSLFEGFGLVITEAMSQGTPVITTKRTIGGDFITHGENGWLVEPGNVEELGKLISEIVYQPQQVRLNGIAARQAAMQRPWSVYEAEMGRQLSTLNKVMK